MAGAIPVWAVGAAGAVQRGLPGRETELAQARTWLTSLGEGTGGGLLVTGEPGIGKTALVGEVLSIADQHRIDHRRTGCTSGTMPMPLAPVEELLLGAPSTSAPRPGARRERFTDALHALRQRHVEGPLLLAIDDLQWADQETLAFLRYAVRSAHQLPVAWLIASRPGHVAELLAEDLQGLAGSSVLRLAGLDLPAVRRLADRVVRTSDTALPIDEDRVRTIHARTDGNPLLTIELLRAAAGQDIPPGIEGSVAVRRRALSPDADEALRWLAVLPRPAQLSWLERLLPTDTDRCLAELTEHAFAQVLGGERVAFVHDVLGDAVAAAIPPRDRRHRQQHILATLHDLPAEATVPLLLAVEQWQDAGRVLLTLADDALLHGGAADAEQRARSAQELARRIGDDTLLLQARATRVLTLLRLGLHDEARAAAGRLIARLQVAGATSALARFLARYAIACWEDASDLAEAAAAVEQLEPLLEALEGTTAAEAQLARVLVRTRQGRITEALAIAEAATELARQAGPVLHTRALVLHGLVRGLAEDAEAGVTVLAAAVDLAEQYDLPTEQASGYLAWSYLAGQSGDEHGHEQLARRGLTVASAPPAVQSLLLANAAQGPATRGELGRAVEELEEAMALAARAGSALEQRVGVSYVHTLVRRGDLDRARTLLAGMDAPTGSFEWLRTAYARGLHAEAAGDTEVARTWYAAGAPYTDHPSVVWSLAGVARLSAVLGELDAAREAVEALERLAPRWPVSGWLLDAARGWVQWAEGDPIAGAALLARAADRRSDAFQRTGLEVAVALVRGDVPALAAAAERFETMGARPSAAHARRLLARVRRGAWSGPPRIADALPGRGDAVTGGDVTGREVTATSAAVASAPVTSPRAAVASAPVAGPPARSASASAGGAASNPGASSAALSGASPRVQPTRRRPPRTDPRLDAAALRSDRAAARLAELLDTWEHAGHHSVQVRCLGPLEVRADGQLLTLPDGRPTRLVALVACSDRALRVAEVADLLWPEVDEQQARSRLRQVLYRLRRVAPVLVTRLPGDRVALSGEALRDLGILQRLEELLTSPGATGLGAARAALGLFRGDLLEDIELPDPPVEVALLGSAVQARRLALLDRVAGAVLDDDPQEALALLRTAHGEDPTDEARAAQLRTLLERLGHSTEAAAVAARTRTALARFGLQPAGEATGGGAMDGRPSPHA